MIGTVRGGRGAVDGYQPGHILDLEVVAEGVDTAAQADRLRAAGIGHTQGTTFADPMPALDLRHWLLRSASVSTAGGIGSFDN